MEQKISAGNKDKTKTVEVVVQFPDNLDAAVEQWGHEACYTLLTRQASTDVQNLVRVAVRDKDASQEDAQKIADEYTPGTRRAGVPRKAAIEKFSKEQLLAALRKLEEAEAA